MRLGARDGERERQRGRESDTVCTGLHGGEMGKGHHTPHADGGTPRGRRRLVQRGFRAVQIENVVLDA